MFIEKLSDGRVRFIYQKDTDPKRVSNRMSIHESKDQIDITFCNSLIVDTFVEDLKVKYEAWKSGEATKANLMLINVPLRIKNTPKNQELLQTKGAYLISQLKSLFE